MASLEDKVARLQEQNAALQRKVRIQASIISRLSIRESQLKQVRRIPVLQHRLNAARGECEELLCELAERRDHEARLSEELRVLRKFVALDAKTETVEVARLCARYEVMQEELKTLHERLKTTYDEREEYRKRTLMLCDEVEYYRQGWRSLLDETRKPEGCVTGEETEGNIVVEGCRFPVEDRTSEARAIGGGCSAETVRAARTLPQCVDDYEPPSSEATLSEASVEAVDVLREQPVESQVEPCHDQTVVASDIACGEPVASAGPKVPAVVKSLRRQLCLSEGMCSLLEDRWNALSEENKSLLRRLRDEEAAGASLRRQLRDVCRECEHLKQIFADLSRVRLSLS